MVCKYRFSGPFRARQPRRTGQKETVMKSFTVPADKDGKHVIRAAIAEYEALTPAVLQKALRHKDIRINGKKISEDLPVASGDIVELWLPDSCFVKSALPSKTDSSMSDYKVVSETDRLLVVNKRQGLAVHSGKGTEGLSLIDIIRRDQKNPAIDLCHRIDMNTGGLVLLAKGKDNLEHAIALFKQDLITKRYRCLVRGVPTEGEPCVCSDETIMKELKAYLEKPGSGDVFIHDVKKDGDLPITTRYRVLKIIKGAGPDGEDVSELEVELVTGRTHQIRAQFAHLGHPILGDGNYGRNQYNRFFQSKSGGHVRYQQLFATTLLFGKIPKENRHASLSNRRFSIVPLYDVDLPFTPEAAK